MWKNISILLVKIMKIKQYVERVILTSKMINITLHVINTNNFYQYSVLKLFT